MLFVETIIRIRRKPEGARPIMAIARDLKLSGKAVRNAMGSPKSAFDYN